MCLVLGLSLLSSRPYTFKAVTAFALSEMRAVLAPVDMVDLRNMSQRQASCRSRQGNRLHRGAAGPEFEALFWVFTEAEARLSCIALCRIPHSRLQRRVEMFSWLIHRAVTVVWMSVDCLAPESPRSPTNPAAKQPRTCTACRTLGFLR